MQPHERLDDALTRRIDELDLTWQELSERSGIHEVTLRAQRRGENKPSPRTKRRLEDALLWERGSVDAILGGDAPTPKRTQAALEGEIAGGLSALESRLEALVAESRGRDLTEAQRKITISWARSLDETLDALDEETG